VKRKNKPKEKTSASVDNSIVASARGFRTKIRRHIFASLMLGACAIFSVAAILSVYASLQVIAVTHTLRVGGVLQAIEQSTPVMHERGGVLSNVFVTEGEIVREGQILASLNTEDLADELKQARQDVARYLLRARCLRALKEQQSELLLPIELKQVLGQLQQVKEMHRETKRCSVLLQKLGLESAFDMVELRAALDLKRLHARLTQTNQLINETGKKLNPFNSPEKEISDEDLKFMKDVLAQSIAATKAEVAYAELTVVLEKKALLRNQKYDAEIAAISDRLVNAQSELTRMENLLSDKFIYATTSGRVQRMRIREAGRRVAAGAYVLEIAPLTTDFEVTSRINVAQAPNLGVGQLVHVQLSGGLPKPIWVPAKVDRILKTSENGRLLSIRLAREDLNKRDLLLGDNSLNGLGERSEAVISINSETAWESLTGSVRTMFKIGNTEINNEV
jgi:multidrug efflux pump subunit AcrA (membrane-fusion protein)